MADENSQAISIFNIFITENPSHAKTDDALSTMATIYFALGKPKEGLKAYQKIIKDYPKGDMVDIAQMQLTIRCEQYKKECQELGITPLPPEKLPLPYELQEKCDVITQFFTEVGSYPILAESYREAFGDMATLKSICGIPADVDIKFECDVTKSCDDYYTEKECKADVCKLACYYSDKTCKKIDCDKITECKDYASYGEIPCREDVCKEGIECAWRVSPKPETCIPIAKEGEDCMIDILVCGDYKTEEACNADKCKYGCSWKDATCKKTTAPAVRVKYKDGKFIDPIESADNKFYVMPGLPGVYIFFKFDPAPKTLDEAKALCSRLKMTVSQGVFVPGSFKIIALPNISQFEMGHCRTNPPAVPTHFRSFFKKKRVDIDIKLLDAPGGSKAISSKLIQLYPTVNRSNIFLLNDGSRSKDYQFQFIKGEWRWCVANTKTLYPMDDWVEGKSSIWWDIIFEEMQEDKKSYVEGMLTLKMAANDKGPGWIFGPSIVIRKLDWPPGASGVIYKDVDDFTEFLIDGYITK